MKPAVAIPKQRPIPKSDKRQESQHEISRQEVRKMHAATKEYLDRTIVEQIITLWTEFSDDALQLILDSYGISFESLDEKLQKEFMSRTNTNFHKIVKSQLDKFARECWAMGEIWIKDEYPFNRHWIMDDAKIQKKLRSYPKLIDILHFIDSQGHHDESIAEPDLKSYTAPITGKKPEERLYSHVIVDKYFYNKAEKDLGIKKNTMQKCLQKFSEAGIIRKKKQLQTHGKAMLYIDGYYRKVPKIGQDKKERFLTERKHKKFLQEFSY